MTLLSLASPWLPAWVFVASVLAYCLGGLFLKAINPRRQKKQELTVAGIDTEKGTLDLALRTDVDEEFQLEKRGFFNKTWLFICHSSRFAKVGDYHSFDVAGASFFVVLAGDQKLRAFHNICRHRAYQVIRKPCGNSTRFSCRYHGWQYNDHGGLVKAPKFENMPGFVPAENGLFEIKLILTKEGLVFVNFDSSTMGMPFSGVKSQMLVPDLHWRESFSFTTNLNWKGIAQDFAYQVSWSRTKFGWVQPWLKQRLCRQLGPLTILRELEEDVWVTQTVLPINGNKTKVQYEILGSDGAVLSSDVVQKWKSQLEKEFTTSSSTANGQSQPFSYECGGRLIELSAILDQQSRLEVFSGTKQSSALRFTGTAEADFEAEELANVLDRKANAPQCSMQSSCTDKIEW